MANLWFRSSSLKTVYSIPRQSSFVVCLLQDIFHSGSRTPSEKTLSSINEADYTLIHMRRHHGISRFLLPGANLARAAWHAESRRRFSPRALKHHQTDCSWASALSSSTAQNGEAGARCPLKTAALSVSVISISAPTFTALLHLVHWLCAGNKSGR